jgi:regulator of sigma E protease
VVGQSAETISVTLSRDDQEITVEIVPTMDQEQDRYIIGITPKMSHSPLTAAIKGTQATWSLTRSMFDSLKMLVTGQVPASDLSGPVGIVSMAGDTTQYGWTYFVFLVALMSLNLAVINMLPLPALDGGRLLFVLIRKVTGKMISDDLEGKIHGIGMVLLFALMIFVTWNDVARLFA